MNTFYGHGRCSLYTGIPEVQLRIRYLHLSHPGFTDWVITNMGREIKLHWLGCTRLLNVPVSLAGRQLCWTISVPPINGRCDSRGAPSSAHYRLDHPLDYSRQAIEGTQLLKHTDLYRDLEA